MQIVFSTALRLDAVVSRIFVSLEYVICAHINVLETSSVILDDVIDLWLQIAFLERNEENSWPRKVEDHSARCVCDPIIEIIVVTWD